MTTSELPALPEPPGPNTDTRTIDMDKVKFVDGWKPNYLRSGPLVGFEYSDGTYVSATCVRVLARKLAQHEAEGRTL